MCYSNGLLPVLLRLLRSFTTGQVAGFVLGVLGVVN
jgi:hypothetical protein